MHIKYSPQRSDDELKYTFNGEIITVTLNGQTDAFDFTDMPNGKAGQIETTLPINPIISAERVDGELRAELLYFHRVNATHEELFPEWQVIE